MESIKALLNYLDTDVKLDRGALDDYISDIQIDVDELQKEKNILVGNATARLYESERELRVIRKVVNRYFKNESEKLEKDLPY